MVKLTYCERCEKGTDSVFNDWFVEFCAECKTRKRYERLPAPFICVICGRMQDNSYSGQSVCSACEGSSYE